MSNPDHLWLWAMLLLVGFLPNEVWRWLGIALARGVDERSEIIIWLRAVATAVLAGVIAKLTIFAPGALAEIPLAARLGAVAIGLAAFYVVRRSVLVGIAAAEAAVVCAALVAR